MEILMAENNVKIHHDAIKILRNIAIPKLSYAFDVVGNHSVGSELSKLVDLIEHASDAASEAFEAKLNEQFQDSQANSVNVLKAVLAGMSINGDANIKEFVGGENTDAPVL
jgi:patatin-like phospholipase/acyl hydrolase